MQISSSTDSCNVPSRTGHLLSLATALFLWAGPSQADPPNAAASAPTAPSPAPQPGARQADAPPPGDLRPGARQADAPPPGDLRPGARQAGAPQPDDLQPGGATNGPTEDDPGRAASAVDVFVRQTKTESAGPFGRLPTTSWQRLPYSVHTISARRMEALQASSSSDALRYDPLVQMQTGGSRVTEYYTLRGFSSSVWTNNISVDGLRAYNPTEPIEDKESIEVVAGANSIFYGMTSPGGMINYVTKRAPSRPKATLTFGDYGGAQGYARADAGGPLGKGVGVRVNAQYVAAGNTGTEHQTNERGLGSAVFDWRPASNVLVSFEASTYRRQARHVQALFMVGKATAIPDAPDNAKNYGGDYGFTADDLERFGARLNWRITPDLTARAAIRSTVFDREYALTRRSWANGAWDYTMRIDYQGRNRNVVPQASAFVDYRLTVAGIENRITAGGSVDQLRTYSPFPNGSYTYTSPTVFPRDSDYPARPTIATIDSGSPFRKTEEALTATALLVDAITVNRFVSAWIGANYATIADDTWAMSTGASSAQYHKEGFTPTLALVVSPLSNVSVYASYNEALQKGGIAPSTAVNANEVLAPFRSSQAEVGAKGSLGGVGLTLAGFRMEQANAYTDASQRYTADGREVHTGLELLLNGNPIEGLFVGGGLTALKAEITKTSTGSLQGKTPQGVAKAMGKFLVEYELPFAPGVALWAGLSYIGKQWVDAANTLRIPDYTLFDLGAGYRTTLLDHGVSVRANVQNVGGTDTWTTRSGILYPGLPRTFAFSVGMGLL